METLRNLTLLPLLHHVCRDRATRVGISAYVEGNLRRWTDTDGEIIGPFTQEVSQILRIRNTGRQPVAFKVCLSLPCLANFAMNDLLTLIIR